MIPFFSLEERNRDFAADLRSAFHASIEGGVFIGGEVLEDFEFEFSNYLDAGRSCVVGVANGLDALRLILEGLDIGPGDEVIVPGFTFIATWLAVAHVGATIVPVDVDPKTANIDLYAVYEAITENTKAVIVVHLYGRMAITSADAKVLQQIGVLVIEDAAQAHGSAIGGLKAGTLGTAAAFSFYPTKNLGCLGDGGAVVTKDAILSRRIRSLANYGVDQENKYMNHHVGWNSRLDPLQAAFLSKFLPYLDKWNTIRRSIADQYLNALTENPNVTRIIGAEKSLQESVWHHFVIQVEDRNSIFKLAKKSGVELGCHYPHLPIDMPAFKRHKQVAARHSLKNARLLARTVVSLPIYPQLPNAQQLAVISALTTHL